MSFDKWYREVGYLGDDQNTRVKIAYEAGQQSKQAEVDKLQKRIDEAFKSSKEFYDFGDGESAMAFCNEIMNILKGSTNEH